MTVDLQLGRVQVTESKSKWDSAVYIRHLERGESFGEAALQSSVLLQRMSFETDLVRLSEKRLDPSISSPMILMVWPVWSLIDRAIERWSPMSCHEWNGMNLFVMLERSNGFARFSRRWMFFSSTTFISGEDERDLKNLRLADTEIVCTLGVGGFGRVELVRDDWRRSSVTRSVRWTRWSIREIRRSTVWNKWRNNMSWRWNSKNTWWMNEISWWKLDRILSSGDFSSIFSSCLVSSLIT